MNEKQFKTRTKQFAVKAIRCVEDLPRGKTADIIGRQLLRSATSVGANYRAACRAKSHADMLAKFAIVEEEVDESLYWMELLIEAEVISADKLTELMEEASEITAMVVASIRTLRSHKS
jgi:four helix bundle protein